MQQPQLTSAKQSSERQPAAPNQTPPAMDTSIAIITGIFTPSVLALIKLSGCARWLHGCLIRREQDRASAIPQTLNSFLARAAHLLPGHVHCAYIANGQGANQEFHITRPDLGPYRPVRDYGRKNHSFRRIVPSRHHCRESFRGSLTRAQLPQAQARV